MHPTTNSLCNETVVAILQVEPFEEVFGPTRKRKRPKLQSDSYGELLSKVEEHSGTYSTKLENGGDRDLVREDDGLRNSGRDSLFSKGQSKRIWGELYKVIDSSDVIIQVSQTTLHSFV